MRFNTRAFMHLVTVFPAVIIVGAILGTSLAWLLGNIELRGQLASVFGLILSGVALHDAKTRHGEMFLSDDEYEGPPLY